MSSNGITLAPATADDMPTLAKVESLVFMDDDFSKVAFGPEKDSPENLAIRVRGLLKTLRPDAQKTTHYFKALVGEEIVGWSSWSFVTPKSRIEGEGGGGREEVERLAKADIDPKEVNDGWGVSANVEFCGHVFVVADEWMIASTNGLPYAKLNVLLVLPTHQRLGIGTYLLSEGLKEVDARGLQCVLGASPEGYELYERYGFKEVGMMELKLWEWKGGEGFGANKHGVMHRPAKVSE